MTDKKLQLTEEGAGPDCAPSSVGYLARMTTKLENFERAFASGLSGCRRTCHCGKVFFHDDEGDYDWEEGEMVELHVMAKLADPIAFALGYSVGTVVIEGTEYVVDCTCWHKRAEQIMNFIDRHAYQIADYLTLEKKRKQADADASPEVKG